MLDQKQSSSDLDWYPDMGCERQLNLKHYNTKVPMNFLEIPSYGFGDGKSYLGKRHSTPDDTKKKVSRKEWTTIKCFPQFMENEN